MDPDLLNYIRKLMVYTIILAVAGYLATLFIPPGLISPTIPVIYLFFFSVALLHHFLLLKSIRSDPKRFINRFMILTFGKLFLYFSLIISYSLVVRSDAVAFILAFAVLYVFYTVFEIKHSFSAARALKKRIENQPDK
jgi:hypothetical protein